MIKNIVKKIPFSIACYELTYNLLKSHSNKKILEQLEKTKQPESLNVIKALQSIRCRLPPEEEKWKKKIEGQRERLLLCQDILNNGDHDGEGYDAGLTVKEACLASKPLRQALFLHLLTRAFRPGKVIELGTNLGISSAYIGAAMKTWQNNGILLTLDASPARQRLAKKVHHNLGIECIEYIQGFFSDTLKPALDKLQSVEMAFIDGHHQYQPTLDYFEQIYKYSTPDTVFIFDDIRWTSGMKNAWAKIQADKRLGLVIDLYSVGIAIPLEEKSQRFVIGPYYLI